MPRVHTSTKLEKILATLQSNTSSPYALKPERMLHLMEFLGNPQNDYKVIHVAGTSGKTSTAYYVAALLKEAGLRTGLTISPHVDTASERAQIDLEVLPEDVFCERFSQFLELIKPSGIVPGYFEAFTAFAFWEFAQQKVDYAVVEVGIGGLVDPTNVIDRDDKLCVITDVGYDHTKILGETLSEIATHKAGIIQLHNAVFVHQQSEDVMTPIYSRSKQKHADLHIVPESNDYTFLPPFQKRNFSLAEATVAYALERDDLASLTEKQLDQAARLPIAARMEVREHAGKKVILDAAHNSQKMQALVRSLRTQFAGEPMTVILGLHKAGPRFVGRLVHELHPIDAHIIVTGFPPDDMGHFGSADAIKVAAAIEAEIGADNVEVIEDPAAAFTAAISRSEGVVVVTGSFYLLNHIRPLL